MSYLNYLLFVDDMDKSGLSYDSKNSYEEINNKIYKEIYTHYNPDIVIDIGANYGFMSIVFSKVFKNAKIISQKRKLKIAEGKENKLEINHKQKIGRNDPCPCESGKKYKKCHGR